MTAQICAQIFCGMYVAHLMRKNFIDLKEIFLVNFR